jgi:hypothetical protein
MHPHKWRRKSIALLLGIVAAMLGAVGVLAASSDETAKQSSPPVVGEPTIHTPQHVLRIIGGRADGKAWEMWLFGNKEGENCWRIKQVVEKRMENETLLGRALWHCDIGVPPRLWTLAAEGPLESKDHRRWALVFFVRRDVGRIKVLTGRNLREGQGSWTHASISGISARRARMARLRPNFGYVVVRVPKPACLRQVVIFSHSEREVERTPLFRCRMTSLFGLHEIQ